MRRKLHYRIDTNNYIKISDYLKTVGYSSHLLTMLRQHEDSILLNDSYVHMNERPHSGDNLIITLPPERPNEKILPVNLPIEIIYEDEDILVINKPAHMPIHPSMEHHDDTLANAVLWHYRDDSDFVYRCMTRLDRDTSGLTLIAKNILSATILSEYVRDGKIEKEYIALVEGNTEESGVIDAPIDRKDGSLVERIVQPAGQRAITNYVKVATYTIDSFNFSMVRLSLETGRTHQIRVHMKHIGHPLLGDFMYNPSDTHLNRQALHCAKMSFNHPIKGAPLLFEAALPDDMNNILN